MMIDVSSKFNTLRYAKAQGRIYTTPDVLTRVATRTVPKGDVIEIARVAGITAAKRTAD